MTGVVTAVAGGVLLRLRIQPRASRSEIVGIQGDALKVRLSAPPVDGAANEALVRFLAELLEVPRSRVTIRSGLASRTKTVHIAAPVPVLLEQKLGLEAAT